MFCGKSCEVLKTQKGFYVHFYYSMNEKDRDYINMFLAKYTLTREMKEKKVNIKRKVVNRIVKKRK